VYETYVSKHITPITGASCWFIISAVLFNCICLLFNIIIYVFVLHSICNILHCIIGVYLYKYRLYIYIYIILLLGRGIGSSSKQPINTNGVRSCIVNGNTPSPCVRECHIKMHHSSINLCQEIVSAEDPKDPVVLCILHSTCLRPASCPPTGRSIDNLLMLVTPADSVWELCVSSTCNSRWHSTWKASCAAVFTVQEASRRIKF